MDEHLQTTGKAVPGYNGKKMTILTWGAANWVWYGTQLVIEPMRFTEQASLDLVWSREHHLGVFLLSYMLKKEGDYISCIFRHYRVLNRPCSMYQYSNMAQRHSGQKIATFWSFFCPSIPKRNLDTKKTTPNIDVCPESLGAMLEYWYIERGLLPNYIVRKAYLWL